TFTPRQAAIGRIRRRTREVRNELLRQPPADPGSTLEESECLLGPDRPASGVIARGWNDAAPTLPRRLDIGPELVSMHLISFRTRARGPSGLKPILKPTGREDMRRHA